MVGADLHLLTLTFLHPLLLHGFKQLGVGAHLVGGAGVAANSRLVLQHLGLVTLLLLPLAGLVDLITQLLDLVDELQVLPHDATVLRLVDLLLLLEPLVQTCLRVLKVAALVILLLLDVNIDFDVLRVAIADMFVKALVDHFL